MFLSFHYCRRRASASATVITEHKRQERSHTLKCKKQNIKKRLNIKLIIVNHKFMVF